MTSNESEDDEESDSWYDYSSEQMFPGLQLSASSYGP